MKPQRSLMICLSVLVLATATLACGIGGTASSPQSNPPAATDTNAAPPAAAENPVDLSSGLIAHYTFDGDVLDASGNGYDGAIYEPEFVEDAHGNPDGALYFNGLYTTVVVEDADALDLVGSFSISMTIKGEENPSHQWLLISKHYAGQCQPDDPSWFLRYYEPSGGLFITLYDHSAECGTHFGYGTDVDLDDGQWHTITVTYDQPSQMLTFYFDCQSVYSETQTLNITGNTQPLVIGNQTMGPDSTNFAGAMDDLYLYDHAVSVDVVNALCAGR